MISKEEIREIIREETRSVLQAALRAVWIEEEAERVYRLTERHVLQKLSEKPDSFFQELPIGNESTTASFGEVL
jgi:hypothetical protein